ncbi:F-box only protein 31-A-like [Argonauta hians]
MLITDFPFEVLVHLFSYLPAPQLATLRLVNKKMLSFVSSMDSVWMDKCNQKCNVKSLTNWGLSSYYELYTIVLHKFGYLIGTWRAVMPPYGSLIKFEPKDGKLVGLELSAPCPPKILSPLRKKLIFTVEVEESKVKALCHMGSNNMAHQCNLSLIDGDSGHMKFECCMEAAHRNPGGMRREFEQFMMDEISEIIFTGKIEVLQKFWLLKKFESGFEMVKMHIPSACLTTVVGAGLYKGDYNVFGFQLVQLSFSQDEETITAYKITGDPHVTGGMTAFEINLMAPILLLKDQQTTLDTVQQHAFTLAQSYKELPEQDFILPEDCHYGGMNLPATCSARFLGKFHVFSNSQEKAALFDCHLIVFTKNSFAILTFETKQLYSFYRVVEQSDF